MKPRRRLSRNRLRFSSRQILFGCVIGLSLFVVILTGRYIYRYPPHWMRMPDVTGKMHAMIAKNTTPPRVAKQKHAKAKQEPAAPIEYEFYENLPNMKMSVSEART